jgi:alkanesulfonate monooxygenase SsuD/methylene tetrahydromethanopterin reductase-like flavin-dependent oxidoreductase (luciferase family)
MPARTPAMTAMTAATLDNISGGRMVLGLGISGPQVVEGWHGQPFDKPLKRTREYVEIVRKALARETLTYDGEIYKLPRPDGQGKPLKLIIKPVQDRIPVYLAAIGPKNSALAFEIATAGCRRSSRRITSTCTNRRWRREPQRAGAPSGTWTSHP